MKNLFPILFLALMLTACGSDEDEKTFVDNLVGEYNGTLKTLNCTLPQEELSNENSTAEITKISETQIDFSIDNTSGNVFSFSATVNADSTITIPQFTATNQEMLKGSASNNTKLRIVLGGDCIIFGEEAATYIFDEI